MKKFFPLSQNKEFKVMKTLLIQVMLFVLLASCNRTTGLPMRPTLTLTSSPEAVASKTYTTTPFETATRTPRPTRTRTPTATPRPPTDTPLPCPPFALDTTLPEPDIPENYVGRHYDMHNLPEGLDLMGGVSLYDKYGTMTEYSISEILLKQERVLWWLEKLICRDKKGNAYFEIIDAIASPPVMLDDPLTVELEGIHRITDWCFQGETEVPATAIGTFDETAPFQIIEGWPTRQYSKIIFAFRINTTVWKFEELDPENLQCFQDEGYRN